MRVKKKIEQQEQAKQKTLMITLETLIQESILPIDIYCIGQTRQLGYSRHFTMETIIHLNMFLSLEYHGLKLHANVNHLHKLTLDQLMINLIV
jgi:hypothetical protein